MIGEPVPLSPGRDDDEATGAELEPALEPPDEPTAAAPTAALATAIEPAAAALTAASPTAGTPASVPAPAPLEPIAATDTWAEAGRKVATLQVGRLLTLDGEIRSPDAVDQLRRYRVATRRLRAGLRLFGEAAAGREAGRLRRDLGQLARAVGAVRDLDVRLGDLEAWAEGRAGGRQRVRPLAEAWRRERADAHRRLLGELDSRRHARLLERLVQLTVVLPDEGRHARSEPGERVLDRGGSALWRGLEQVLAFGPAVPSAGVGELHALRIEAKRLRYALEFLREALDQRSSLLVARLVALQDRLGATNDAAATARALARFIGDSGDGLGDRERRAVVLYQSAVLGRLARARRRVPAAWRPIASRAFGRRLAMIVADLAAADLPTAHRTDLPTQQRTDGGPAAT